MASLDTIVDDPFIKMMLIGDSGTGKTSALASLVEAGYKLRIVDMDDGIAPLANRLRAKDPALLKSVDVMSFRDKYRPTQGGMDLVMPAKAYLGATKTMNKWEDDTVPSEWGPDYIYVVDSFTILAKAAFNQAISVAPNCKDPRQWYGAAQTAAENFLACIMGPDFKTNVVVITHIQEIELADGTTKGFPSAVGKALSRHIAKWLNNLVVAEITGTGEKVKRTLRTVSNGVTDGKTAAVGLPSAVPMDTGLAQIFKALGGK